MPPGPRMPLALQTVAMMNRQRPFLERQRRRHGSIITIRIAALGQMVVVSDPELIKQTFKADPKVLHAGSRSPLRRILGDNSLLSIDEDRHLEQRKLLLPPFKGQRMRAYESLIGELASDEIDRIPRGVPVASAPIFQRITLRAILRAVFGATGPRFDRLEAMLPKLTEDGQRLSRFPRAQRDLGPRSPWGAFLRLRGRVDRELDGLIEDARVDAALEERTDVLALMVRARRVNGEPMRNAEIRDQLVTMLAAGHETTAHTLGWAVERLSRNPRSLERLVAEIDAGESKAYLDATIREVQRMRPVIMFAGRFVMQPFELGGYTIPPGVLIGLSAGLTHYDTALFPEPDRFRPERFLETNPGTYEWIPFGGGIRRCIGATFAHMELEVVLRTLLTKLELETTAAPDERWRFKGVAWTPRDGAPATFHDRSRSASPVALGEAADAEPAAATR